MNYTEIAIVVPILSFIIAVFTLILGAVVYWVIDMWKYICTMKKK